jgi:epoxyqueuosine reductase
LEPIAELLRQRLPGVQTLICVDTKPIMERAAAALAGLGFIGKHGCVIVPGLGSYVVLGAVLSTAAIESPPAASWQPSKVLWDACGSCRRCLDACPTHAFEAPGELDPRRCISYLTIEHRGPIDEELADAMGERIAGCDVCQEVCPYNATGHRNDEGLASAWLDPPPPTSLSADLPALANIGSNPYKTFVKNTALRRIPRKAMRRNALLALGNRAGALAEDERVAIDRAEGDPELQIAAAAQRARHRRG